MFTSQEKRAIIFLCCLLLCGGILRVVRVHTRDLPSVFSQSQQRAPLQVNINIASAQDLTQLPGIGEVTAKRIVAYRLRHGVFGSYDDLKKVKGIGDKKIDAIRKYIVL